MDSIISAPFLLVDYDKEELSSLKRTWSTKDNIKQIRTEVGCTLNALHCGFN